MVFPKLAGFWKEKEARPCARGGVPSGQRARTDRVARSGVSGSTSFTVISAVTVRSFN